MRKNQKQKVKLKIIIIMADKKKFEKPQMEVIKLGTTASFLVSSLCPTDICYCDSGSTD